MAESSVLLPTEITVDVASALINLSRWLQAVGVLVLLWIIFQARNYFINRKRLKKLDNLSADIKRLENKINKIAKKI